MSWPTYSGPVMALLARYSQMACVMARMWASVKVPLSEVPRWPLVPKRDALRGDVDIGRVRRRRQGGRHVDEHVGGDARTSEGMRHGVNITHNA